MNEQDDTKLKASTVKTLMPYFEQNCSADYAAMKTKIARGTVQKYFRVWSNKLIEKLDSDFIKAQKEAKARGLFALESRIHEVIEVLATLTELNKIHMNNEEKKAKKDKSYVIEVNKWLIDRISRLTKDVFNMEQIKVMIQMKPTADVTLQWQIDELLAKVKPEDLQHLIDEAKEKE